MLEDLVLPNEKIRFRREMPGLDVDDDTFDEMIITDKRFIFYKQEGLIFKNDVVETIGLSDVTGVKLKEKGKIRKKGILEIHGDEVRSIEGNLLDMKHLYQFFAAKMN